jgi:transposase InsO family protein
MLNRIGDHGSDIYGVMDLCQGYHQNKVDKSTKVFLAFIVFCGIFQFLRLPFGPKKAPSHFQEQMAATVLIGLIYMICEVYLDDIIVHGKTNEEFLTRLEEVFLRMRKFKLILKPAKCKFGMPKVEYCGRVISKDGLTMSSKKIASVANFPEPVFARELKSFLGLANYFREFIANHSTIVQPLQALLPDYKRSNRLVWNAEARLAYTAIKQMINDCPTMYFLVAEGVLYLYTDASDYGIGGYLYQVVDGSERPVAFMSKSLTSTQLRWPIIQKEAYAIFVSIKQLEHLLRDRRFIVRTDHKNLLYITDSSNPMIIRWYMSIQEFDYTQEFTLGSQNPIADGFSRLCPNLMKEEPLIYDDMDILCSVMNKFRIDSNEYTLLSEVHNSVVGHHGVERTIRKMLVRLKGQPKWKFLRQKVKRFILECPCCQKMSQLKVPIHAHPFTTSAYSPMEVLNIDFLGPYPDSGYILVIIDAFTRWIELACTDAATAKCAAEALLQHFGRYGCPAQLRSDRGSHFIADVIEEFTRLVGTEHTLTLAYSKEENAIVERSNKEINRHLRALTFHKNTVDEYKLSVPIVQRIMNSSYHEVTGIAPAELLFGNAIKLDRGLFLTPAERNASVLTKPLSESASELLRIQDELINYAKESLQLTDSQRLGYYDPERTEFASGDHVLVKYRTGAPPTRLHTKWKGPLRVISNHFSHYTLLDLVTNKEKVYHITDLKDFFFDPSIHDPLDIARKDYLEFFVEKVLAHKGDPRRKKSLEFHIKWLGYESSYNSWEPWHNFKDVEFLHDYLRDNNMSFLIPKKFK